MYHNLSSSAPSISDVIFERERFGVDEKQEIHICKTSPAYVWHLYEEEGDCGVLSEIPKRTWCSKSTHMSDLQGGHKGELLEIEMQEFLDYLHIYDPNV